MSMVSLTIDKRHVTVPAGVSILEAAKAANIHIPTLCYLPEDQAIGETRSKGEKPKGRIDDSNPSVVRDASKCILCRRCVTVCQEIQQVGALCAQERGFDTYVGPAFGDDLGED